MIKKTTTLDIRVHVRFGKFRKYKFMTLEIKRVQ